MALTREQAVKIAEDRNRLGFEGDTIMAEKFRYIIESLGIKTVIETGTYMGATTRLLSQWVDVVHTIEIDAENYKRARENLREYNNVRCMLGNSSIGIGALIEMKLNEPLLIFLDAHWGAYNPLLDELAAIANSGIKPACIAIHDFKVPGHPELGFDSYGGQDYEWDWIASSIEKIYGSYYTIEYNSEATGAKQGIIYIYDATK